MKWLLLILTHLGVGAAGFALGIYLLPILTAPPGPDASEVASVAQAANYRAEFRKDLKGSDFLHWGTGEISVGTDKIAHSGELSPGPDFKLYLTKGFVETKEEFEAVKSAAVRIGDVKSFKGFVLNVPEGVDVSAYDTVVVWCEAFGAFITAAKYQN